MNLSIGTEDMPSSSEEKGVIRGAARPRVRVSSAGSVFWKNSRIEINRTVLNRFNRFERLELFETV
jgi:hypothetical protein